MDPAASNGVQHGVLGSRVWGRLKREREAEDSRLAEQQEVDAEAAARRARDREARLQQEYFRKREEIRRQREEEEQARRGEGRPDY